MPSPEPLIAQPPASETSNDDPLQEEDALLTGQRTGKSSPPSDPTRRWRELGLFAWALLATATVIVLAVVYQHNLSSTTPDRGRGNRLPTGKRNLVFMVSDGMGPTSLALTREWRQYSEGLAWDQTLLLDRHLVGQSRTRSASSLVTDSAAGATAFSCGRKSYNGAVSVLPDGFAPCASVMEAAKRAGFATGLVVTTRVTDATPAVFASHVRRREMEDAIAVQMLGLREGGTGLGRVVDLVVGGGRCHFLSNGSEGSCRGDGRQVLEEAGEEHGWGYVDSREGFDALDGGRNVTLPLLALLAEGDIPYEIDRRFQNDTYPSLEEAAVMALTALEAATKDSEQGFFIMIEGSRIDHAGHANDPAAQVHEVLAYDHTMAAVLDFIEKTETPTMMVATSDHETGGLAAARQLHATYPEYLWHPSVLANATHSAAWAASQYHAHLQTHQTAHHSDAPPTEASEDTRAYLTALLSSSHGMTDASQAELDALLQHPDHAAYTIADMVSRRAQTGWSTHGHSGADVNIYASDRGVAQALTGNHENTEVGGFLRDYLGVGDLMAEITKELQQTMGPGILGEVPEEGERLDGQDHLDRVDVAKMDPRGAALQHDYHVKRLAETPDLGLGLEPCGFCEGGR